MMETDEIEVMQTVSIFDEVKNMGHEQVVFCYDEATGLRSIIGIHNTVLGPSLGGTRMWDYATEAEAVTDVLRLSRGMTFKAAITGLNIGGGKAVIIGDPKTKSEALLRRFGKFVDSLGGRYITAEDVNINPHDMEYVGMETSHVTGLPEKTGGGGDPSPVTAYGVYMGMKAAANRTFGSDNLEGKRVIVQGVGQVGKYLVDHLAEEGCTIFIADIDEDKLQQVSKKHKVEVVDDKDLYDLDCDIYAPCALGATVNDDTIEKLKCAIIAGGANNQLLDEKRHGEILLEKGIVYVPDFVINAGGLINVYLDFLGGHSRERAYRMAEKIYDNCRDILDESYNSKIPAQEAAIKLAYERIKKIGKIKLSY